MSTCLACVQAHPPSAAQPLGPRCAARGMVLPLSLVLLVVLGLASASAMRLSLSSERVVNNLRMHQLAHQQAELALHYCESQLALPSAERIAALRDEAIAPAVAGTSRWQAVAPWVGGSVEAVAPPTAWWGAAESPVPAVTPRCLAERSLLSDGHEVWTVTARGFSPDYAADPSSGRSQRGASVWLQSTLLLQPVADPAAPRPRADRLWRRIINPPVR